MKVKDREERDKAICERVAERTTMVDVARQFDLSVQRVS